MSDDRIATPTLLAAGSKVVVPASTLSAAGSPATAVKAGQALLLFVQGNVQTDAKLRGELAAFFKVVEECAAL